MTAIMLNVPAKNTKADAAATPKPKSSPAKAPAPKSAPKKKPAKTAPKKASKKPTSKTADLTKAGPAPKSKFVDIDTLFGAAFDMDSDPKRFVGCMIISTNDQDAYKTSQYDGNKKLLLAIERYFNTSENTMTAKTDNRKVLPPSKTVAKVPGKITRYEPKAIKQPKATKQPEAVTKKSKKETNTAKEPKKLLSKKEKAAKKLQTLSQTAKLKMEKQIKDKQN